jgi:Cytidylate kinase-like family
MAFISISGEPGCRHEELARIVARMLNCELLPDSRLVELIAVEFGDPSGIPEKAWPHLATSILARLGAQHHVLLSGTGSELLFANLPGGLRIHVLAPESRRVGNLMVDQRLDRSGAKELLKRLESDETATRKNRFGKAGSRLQNFDIVLNAETLAVDEMADVIAAAVKSKGLMEAGVLSLAAEAEVLFQVRLKLARYGIVPPDRIHLERKEFGHPTEEVFANLLDFYRIAWDYEPRSFALQWDKDGKVLEAFTPDFYLPEFDMYVELTTMKQANVTRKNRKIRLLRAIYPHVNIQVFYQKDVQDLVMKYGLPERLAQ